MTGGVWINGQRGWNGPENRTIIPGRLARHYSCRDLAEVDVHLRGLSRWLVRELRTAQWATSPAQRAKLIRARYWHDCDALLDARIMLAALSTLDDDLRGEDGETKGTPPKEAQEKSIRVAWKT
jgi:hypothetical protein